MLCNSQRPMISRSDLQQCLMDSARNVFRVTADIVLKVSQCQLAGQQEGWLTALVGFEGSYCGVVALHCPQSLARRTSAEMLCMGDELLLVDVFDAMGEIVNILSGDIKLFLDRRGRQVRLSTPSVFVTDGDFREIFPSASEAIACTLYAGDERLMIAVNISDG